MNKVLKAAVLAASFAASMTAAAADAVSFRLNWYVVGLHAPFYYGKERGFFKDEGIDLTINEGRGSINTVQVVAAGSDQFGFADSSSVVLVAAKGGDVRSVMSLVNTSPFAVISRADSNIRTPKDLEGKRLALAQGDPFFQLFAAMAAQNKIDTSKITMVQVDPAGKTVAVLERRADALLGSIDDQFFAIKHRGIEPAALRFADHGVDIVGYSVLAHTTVIKNNPDLVRRFVKATARSWEEARKNPAAAIDAAMKVKPDLNRQTLMDQMNADLALMDSKNSKGRTGFGAQPDWDRSITLLKEYRDVKTDKNWTFFHTNEFLPK
jgi:NitT/TauT family transport system substrate-binding protein